MRNFEKSSRSAARNATYSHVYGEEVRKKGSKLNKTKRGGGNKGFFFDMNTGKSLLSVIYGD